MFFRPTAILIPEQFLPKRSCQRNEVAGALRFHDDPHCRALDRFSREGEGTGA
jgi:hypothetical protein